MKLEARIFFNIKYVFKEHKIQDIDISRLRKNVKWKTEKGDYRKADFVLIVPKSGNQVYCYNHGTLVYNNNNYNHTSAKSLLSLIKEGYVTIKKIIGKSRLEFKEDIGLVLQRRGFKKTLPNLDKCINNVGKKLFSEYELLGVDKSKNYINIILKATPKEPTLDDYFRGK